MIRASLLLLVAAVPSFAAVIPDVRAAIARKDFKAAEALAEAERKQSGDTPEVAEAISWLGRGALAEKQYDRALHWAAEARKSALAAAKKVKFDSERHVPIALGASIEVQAQAMAATGDRNGALSFLAGELKQWGGASIRTRIQKNINLLSLEGKPAPPLDAPAYLGAKPTPLAQLKGKPVLLFFWAHWCGDCKYQAPMLQRLQSEYKDLAIVGPTQRYGYTARGEDATPEAELKYIEEIRKQHYGSIANMAVPVSEEGFKQWGASTTPTLVLIDRQGIIRLYHPGKMTYEELTKHDSVLR